MASSAPAENSIQMTGFSFHTLLGNPGAAKANVPDAHCPFTVTKHRIPSPLSISRASQLQGHNEEMQAFCFWEGILPLRAATLRGPPSNRVAPWESQNSDGFSDGS